MKKMLIQLPEAWDKEIQWRSQNSDLKVRLKKKTLGLK